MLQVYGSGQTVSDPQRQQLLEQQGRNDVRGWRHPGGSVAVLGNRHRPGVCGQARVALIAGALQLQTPACRIHRGRLVAEPGYPGRCVENGTFSE